MNETLNTIYNRTSCRSFQETAIPTEIIQTIVEAGLQAPSGRNLQVCHITVITNQDMIKRLTAAINQELNRDNNSSCFYHAHTIVIVSGSRDSSHLNYDGSCILQNIFLAATSLGIGSCWINQLKGIEDVPSIRAILTKCHIPSSHLVVGCASLGYPKEKGITKQKDKSRIHYVK